VAPLASCITNWQCRPRGRLPPPAGEPMVSPGVTGLPARPASAVLLDLADDAPKLAPAFGVRALRVVFLLEPRRHLARIRPPPVGAGEFIEMGLVAEHVLGRDPVAETAPRGGRGPAMVLRLTYVSLSTRTGHFRTRSRNPPRLPPETHVPL
jgi:hypothetical protein